MTKTLQKLRISGHSGRMSALSSSYGEHTLVLAVTMSVAARLRGGIDGGHHALQGWKLRLLGNMTAWETENHSWGGEVWAAISFPKPVFDAMMANYIKDRTITLAHVVHNVIENRLPDILEGGKLDIETDQHEMD
jgi:hypothetical protein